MRLGAGEDGVLRSEHSLRCRSVPLSLRVALERVRDGDSTKMRIYLLQYMLSHLGYVDILGESNDLVITEMVEGSLRTEMPI